MCQLDSPYAFLYIFRNDGNDDDDADVDYDDDGKMKTPTKPHIKTHKNKKIF